jgi:hypothetical protein
METAKHTTFPCLLVSWLALLGCSSDAQDAPPSLGGTSNVSTAGNGPNEGSTGGMASETGSGGTPSTGGSGTVANGGAGSGSAFAEVGVCGQRGQSPVSATTFEGFEEFYLIGEEGFGDDICVVRFQVKRVGDAPGGCEDCVWTHLIGYEMPSVVTDVDGVCESSELGMDMARTDAILSSTAAYGFVEEYSGHNSVLMKYDEATGLWEPFGNATWDPMTNAFRFDRRDGFCGY